MIKTILFALALIFSDYAVAKLCPIVGAKYSSMANPGLTARFNLIGNRSSNFRDLQLSLHSAQDNSNFYFFFYGGTARHIFLQSVSDDLANLSSNKSPGEKAGPLGDMEYISADNNLKFNMEIPNSSNQAPKYILLPDLPEKMWYNDLQQRKDFVLSFFKKTACGS